MKTPFLSLCAAVYMLLVLPSCNNPVPDASKAKPETEQVLDDNDCPPEGNAKSERVRELNKLKNRQQDPTPSDFDPALTLEALLEPGDDISRWSVSRAGRISGYVYDVKVGGDETCNCKAIDKIHRDTHIELVVDPEDAAKTRRMVVEVTPRMRNKMKLVGQDWSTPHLRDALLGRWVELRAGCYLMKSTGRRLKIQTPVGSATGELQPGKFTRLQKLR
jgi:hypothetical protein